MLSWAFTFLVIALIAALLGFTGVAGAAAAVAKAALWGLPHRLSGVVRPWRSSLEKR
jgi:hypothetical protein